MTADPTTPYTRSLLLPLLAGQQKRVLGILEGLDEDAARRPVLPSGWCCVGMVQHLTMMTRFWFSDVMTGSLSDYPDDEFAVPHHRTVADVLDAYAHEAEATAVQMQELSPATPPAWWPHDRWGGWRLGSLSEVVAHVLVETSSHAGHLDTARELIDGRTWDHEKGRLGGPQ